MKERDGKLDSFHKDKVNIERKTISSWILNLKVFIYVIRLYNTGEQSKPEKK